MDIVARGSCARERYVCVRRGSGVYGRRLDRRLLGPNEGRRREAKDDALGWRDSYGRGGGVDTGRRIAWWGGKEIVGRYDNRLSYLRAAATSPTFPPVFLPTDPLLLLRPVCPLYPPSPSFLFPVPTLHRPALSVTIQ